MAMLFASCCTHSTTNDSDVVTVKDGEQRLGAEQAEQATIDAKKTDRAAVETVEEMLRLEEGFKEEDKGPQGEETSTAKQAVSEVDPIKEIISSVAPMVRNRVGTHSKQNPMTSKRFTVAGAKAAASPPGSFSKSPPAPAPTDATRSSTASAAMRNTAVSQAGGSRGTQRTTQRTSQMSSRSTRRARGSAMSSHSSASAMFLKGIGIDVRRRGRGSVISHHHGRVREDFDLLESLGVGGFGEVFRAQRKQDGHICAIKSVDLEKTDPEVFQIELDQARQLKHPNVVRLLTAYRDETAFWLVMELYPGGDLTGEILKNNFRRDEESGFWVVGIPDHRLARYAYQIFSGLAYLHYHKIVHRDIKPENFMRTTPDERESQLVLIDLGVSANLKVTPILNETVGTLTTIAPELFLGDYDEKCDLWSVGMTLYMCAVCKRTPIEVRRAGAAAKNDSPKLQMLQEQWASCKGMWSQSDFVIRLRQKTRQRQYGARRWMTRQELICKYSSCAIADKIIAAKQGDKEAKKTQIRSHPDLHGDDSDDTRQYLVWDKEGSENTTDHVCSELFTAAEKGDDPLETRRGRSRKRKDKKGRKSNKKKRKGSTSSTRSSSSSSSSQEKVDSSSSSSEAAKKKKKGKSKTGKTKSKNGKASKTAAKAKGKKDKKDKDKDKDKDKKKPKEVISSDSSDESEEPEETEEKKQKRLAKEAEAQKKKEAKDAEQAKKKAEREKNQELKKEQKKGTQALSKLGANILKAAGLDEKLESMSKSVKDAILMEVKPHLDKLRSTRRSLQNAVDSAQVGNLGSMHSLIAKADSVNADFVTFLSAYNIK